MSQRKMHKTHDLNSKFRRILRGGSAATEPQQREEITTLQLGSKGVTNFVPEMTYKVSSGTLAPTHSLVITSNISESCCHHKSDQSWDIVCAGVLMIEQLSCKGERKCWEHPETVTADFLSLRDVFWQ